MSPICQESRGSRLSSKCEGKRSSLSLCEMGMAPPISTLNPLSKREKTRSSICKEMSGSRLRHRGGNSDIETTTPKLRQKPRNRDAGFENRTAAPKSGQQLPHSNGNSDFYSRSSLKKRREERKSSLLNRVKRGCRLYTHPLSQKEKRESHLYVKRVEEVVSPRNAKGGGRLSHCVKSEWHLRSLH